MRTIEKTVYTFDELSDKAKETARDWWRSNMDNEDFADFVIEDAVTVSALFGLEIDTHPVKLMGGGTRQDPNIFYSGFYSQGDGACYEGRYVYKPGALKAVKAEAPEDKELHHIVEALQSLQKRYGYKLTATLKHNDPHYYHAHTMDTEWEYTGAAERRMNEATAYGTKLLRDFADWIYKQLEESYNWVSADEQVDENIIANEYEFYEDGSII